MGYIDTISYNRFPKQSDRIDFDVRVCYHYDTTKHHCGKIVRDDIEFPYETIILLDNGNLVRGAECQYTILF